MKRLLNAQNVIEDKTCIKELLKLLSEEISAINNGDLDRVVDLFEQKTSLLDRLDAATAEIEAQLKLETKAAADLRKSLTELNGLIQQDADLLTNMVDATHEIKAVIARIRRRHSLEGSYSLDGEKQTGAVVFSQHIDQSM